MASDISLTRGQRSSLIALRDIDQFLTRTQRRLASGNRINDVTDGPGAFFAARSLSNRSRLFIERKDDIDQGIETLRAALNGLEAAEQLARQLIGIVAEARSQLSVVARGESTSSFNEIGLQFVNLVNDTNYRGLNLLNNTSSVLQVDFSNDAASRLSVAARDLLGAGVAGGAGGVFSNAGSVGIGGVTASVSGGLLQLITGTGSGFADLFGGTLSTLSNADTLTQGLRATVDSIQLRAQTLGTRVAILQERSDFSQDYATTLSGGADTLTLADLNEEGANLTALRTRNQIGVEALAVTSSQQSAILTIFNR